MAHRSEKVVKEEKGMRLDRWMKKHHPDVTHALLQKWLRKGALKVDGKKVKHNHVLLGTEEIRTPEYQETERKPTTHKTKISEAQYKELLHSRILYQDEEVLALNKPAGLPAQGGSGVSLSVDDLLQFGTKRGDFAIKPKLCHRIDKDTSGVLLLAKTTEAAQKLTLAFKARDMEKRYWAIVIGRLPKKEGEIRLPIAAKQQSGTVEKAAVDEVNGKNAVTQFRVIDQAASKVSFVELRPLTGRMHQIRVHMQAIGHPVLGDGKYGGREAFIEGLSNQMHLHARELVIPADVLGKKRPLQLIAPPSELMEETLADLGMDVPATSFAWD